MAAKVADNGMEDIAKYAFSFNVVEFSLTDNSSLTEAEVVPTKLRCAICDKVAFNAFKLPCCDQNICSNCTSHVTISSCRHQHVPGQSSLPEACPICQHSPLNADDAKPSKS